MKKTLFKICVTAVFVICASVTSNLAQGKSQQFQVTEAGDLRAMVIAQRNDEVVKVSILRPNQPTHVYRTAIWAGVTSVHINGKNLFAYQNTSKRVEIGNTDFIATEVNIAARKARSEVVSLSQELTDDMRILRAVRDFAPNADVRLAELAYVIATGEDSIYRGEAPKSLRVSEGTKNTGKTSAQTKLIKTSAVSRMQGTLEGCKSDCASVRRNCTSDPRVPDPTVCYTNENNCNLECHRIYKDAPAPEDPPEN
jgi:hypothetical protein